MTKAQRRERLLPHGVPRYIRIYDNRGKTIDRYTVVFTRLNNFVCEFISLSETPSHWGYGFAQHGWSRDPIDRPSYAHLGTKITFDQLPPDCQQLVLDEYCEDWNL